MPRLSLTIRARIERAVVIDAKGCWIWQKATSNGYGRISVNGHVKGAHWVAYREWRGEIPEGMEIDHLCRVTACCNPDHLEAVTHRENLWRGARRTRAA